jgi:predicted O-methyltransferase YrrM
LGKEALLAAIQLLSRAVGGQKRAPCLNRIVAVDTGHRRCRPKRPVTRSFDLILADTWPGKFSHLDETLRLLRPGGLYAIDDLLPQPNWPEGHAGKVERLLAEMHRRSELVLTRLDWATSIVVATRRATPTEFLAWLTFSGPTRRWLSLG